MSNDPLNRDVALTAEWSGSGIRVAAQSRFAAAVDRLGGNAVDLLNIGAEAILDPLRDRLRLRKAIRGKLEEASIRRIDSDPTLLDRSVENVLVEAIERQKRKDGVLERTKEVLLASPIAKADEEVASQQPLSEEFLQRLDTYAGGATDDVAQSKWAKVLAGEIQTPGLFTPRVMRIIDEIDRETALLFDKFIRKRTGVMVMRNRRSDLKIAEIARLRSADLIVEPGFTGQQYSAGDTKSHDGTPLWFFGDGEFGLSFPKSLQLDSLVKQDVLIDDDGRPALPIYMLTEAGKAIAAISGDFRLTTFLEIKNTIFKITGQDAATLYQLQGSNWAPLVVNQASS